MTLFTINNEGMYATKIHFQHILCTLSVCCVFNVSYRQTVVVYEDQADTHGNVCYKRQRSQVLEIADKHQHDDKGKEEEHVEARVVTGDNQCGLVVVTVHSCRIGSLNHLQWKDSFMAITI